MEERCRVRIAGWSEGERACSGPQRPEPKNGQRECAWRPGVSRAGSLVGCVRAVDPGARTDRAGDTTSRGRRRVGTVRRGRPRRGRGLGDCRAQWWRGHRGRESRTRRRRRGAGCESARSLAGRLHGGAGDRTWAEGGCPAGSTARSLPLPRAPAHRRATPVPPKDAHSTGGAFRPDQEGGQWA